MSTDKKEQPAYGRRSINPEHFNSFKDDEDSTPFELKFTSKPAISTPGVSEKKRKVNTGFLESSDDEVYSSEGVYYFFAENSLVNICVAHQGTDLVPKVASIKGSGMENIDNATMEVELGGITEKNTLYLNSYSRFKEEWVYGEAMDTTEILKILQNRRNGSNINISDTSSNLDGCLGLYYDIENIIEMVRKCVSQGYISEEDLMSVEQALSSEEYILIVFTSIGKESVEGFTYREFGEGNVTEILTKDVKKDFMTTLENKGCYTLEKQVENAFNNGNYGGSFLKPIKMETSSGTMQDELQYRGRALETIVKCMSMSIPLYFVLYKTDGGWEVLAYDMKMCI